MKIITVNLAEEEINLIDDLCGEKKAYPSRSELIRVAVREYLIQVLSENKNKESVKKKEVPNDQTVDVPFQSKDGSKGVKKFRIIQKS